ncbi:hypothetical protein KAI87_11470, partial [Myxococcota bacterium]|nr:hypothetical protein [Myxococcota bacterium]
MRFFLGALTSIFLISSCATTIPMPAHLSTLDTAALRQKLEKSKVAVKDYSAEARLSYFGREGRLRGSAIVAVQRSDKIRIEILGPHGGTLSAFATDGKEVGLFDLGGEHFLYGKATAANLDRALSLVPLSQDATAWASLFFGEVLIPANAKLSWDEKRGELVLSWSEDHLDRVVG